VILAISEQWGPDNSFDYFVERNCMQRFTGRITVFLVYVGYGLASVVIGEILQLYSSRNDPGGMMGVSPLSMLFIFGIGLVLCRRFRNIHKSNPSFCERRTIDIVSAASMFIGFGAIGAVGGFTLAFFFVTPLRENETIVETICFIMAGALGLVVWWIDHREKA
jgi:nitrate/nitrite transporter NarK